MSSKIINIFCYITQCLILCGVQNFIVPLKNSTQGVFNTSDAAFVIIIKFIISFLSAKPYLISRNKFFARCQFIAHSLLVKSPSKSALSVLPFHGSIHTKGTPFPTGDHIPNTGVSNSTVTIVLSSFTRLTLFIVLFSTI